MARSGLVVLLSTVLFVRANLSPPIGIVALGDSNTAGYGVGRDRRLRSAASRRDTQHLDTHAPGAALP
jgi:hypothetical protein